MKKLPGFVIRNENIVLQSRKTAQKRLLIPQRASLMRHRRAPLAVVILVSLGDPTNKSADGLLVMDGCVCWLLLQLILLGLRYHTSW